jgi:hypothetical protein
MSRGPNVFAVSRAIWDHDLFADEPFSEREAWIWLIGAAAWKDIKVRINGAPVAIKRGEFCFAVRFLAEKFQWSKSGTARFIQRLEKQDIIRDASRDNAKIYSINKYNHFQVVGLPKRDTERDDDRDLIGTSLGQVRDKEETGKQDNRIIEQQEPVASAPVSRETSKALVVVQSLPDWLPLEAWSAYLEMRRRKRAAPTPHAINLILGRLDRWRKLGHDPTDILNTSTRSNWTDIYEPKDGKNGNSRQRTANSNNLAGAALAIASLDSDDVQFGQATGDSDAGGPLLPLLDARFHTGTGGREV